MTFTSTSGRFVLEFERGDHIFMRMLRVGECFVSLDGRGPSERRVVWNRWNEVERMLNPR